MKNLVRFTKMHGAGNDYIYVDTSLYDVPEPEKAAVALSDRHTGIFFFKQKTAYEIRE